MPPANARDGPMLRGKKYLIYGDNYNITISPLKEIQTFQSTYVDLSLCEDILREKYNLPHDEILTILQIEIDKMNEKSITNQLEYAIYNQKKDKLDLSFCSLNNENLWKFFRNNFGLLNLEELNLSNNFFTDNVFNLSSLSSEEYFIYSSYSLFSLNFIFSVLQKLRYRRNENSKEQKSFGIARLGYVFFKPF